MGYFVIGLVVLIYVAVFVASKKRKDKLYSAGVMIKREHDFYRQKETFTLRLFEFEELVDMLEQMEWNGVDTLRYNKKEKYVVFGFADQWEGRLRHVADTDTSTVYECYFQSWTTKNGSNTCAQEMNMALTTIEKALVMLDPETTVCAEYGKAHTEAKRKSN